MDSFLEAMHYRHATKVFNTEKKIGEEDMINILEVGRLSPSSYGFEPWKFVVVENQELKEKLTPACYNQKQISTGSHIVVFITKHHDVRPHSSYLQELLSSRIPDKTIVEKILKFQAIQVEKFSQDRFDMWVKAQCYIPAANMMTYAAEKKIDSCPMEGFDEEEVLNVLGYDKEKYGVALIVAFGYRENEPREKARLPLEKVVDFRK